MKFSEKQVKDMFTRATTLIKTIFPVLPGTKVMEIESGVLWYVDSVMITCEKSIVSSFQFSYQYRLKRLPPTGSLVLSNQSVYTKVGFFKHCEVVE